MDYRRGEKTLFKAVLFDVDGVLLEADDAIYRVRRDALARFGFKPPSRKKILVYSGLSTKPWLAKLVPRASEKTLREMNAWTTRVYARDYLPRYCKPKAGVRETLLALRRKGLKLGIVSNQTMGEIRATCAVIGCNPFQVVISRGCAHPKPSADGLRKAMRALGVKPTQVIYVGDSESDLLASARAGVCFALVDLPRNKNLVARRIKRLCDLLEIV